MNQEDKNRERDLAFKAAAKIIEAIIPFEDFKRSFKDSFVLLKQKDIIGGDFFFVHQDKFEIIALIDCTGHSVEGVMSAVLINQFFMDVVRCDGETDPKIILDTVNRKLQRLYQSNSITADAVVLTLDRKHNKIHFAGAMRPFYYSDSDDIKIIKGSRVRIGDSNYNINDIEVVAFDIEKGTKIYLASDGIESQVGGLKNKRLMTRGLLDWIKQGSKIEPFANQKEFFELKISEYIQQGSEEQLDDIIMIGFKV